MLLRGYVLAARRAARLVAAVSLAVGFAAAVVVRRTRAITVVRWSRTGTHVDADRVGSDAGTTTEFGDVCGARGTIA